jgi:hypothetical protein
MNKSFLNRFNKLVGLLKEDVETPYEIPVDNLLVSRRSMFGTMQDFEDGKSSRTTGPLEVWKMEDGSLQLINGYHRLFQSLLMGCKKVTIQIVGEGYTDYWTKTSSTDKFHFDTNLKFGGLEDLADDDILIDLYDKYKF